MNKKDLLKSQLEICDMHYSRLKLAIAKIGNFFPLDEKFLSLISEDNLGYLEILTTRFAKLQDMLGEKVFVSILDILGEDIAGKSFIDKLNKLEKLEMIPSADWWRSLRDLRNALTHEYPNELALMADNLNLTFIEAQNLCAFYEFLKQKFNE